MRLALYEPDIPQNTGALLRLAACLGVAVDLIEPFGFVFDDRRLKRAALDYAALARVTRHASWASFLAERSADSRLVLLTTSGDVPLCRFAFSPNDALLLGRESAGVPPHVHAAATARVVIPLRAPARSLNVAQAGAIALYEALRQTNQLPDGQLPDGPAGGHDDDRGRRPPTARRRLVRRAPRPHLPRIRSDRGRIRP